MGRSRYKFTDYRFPFFITCTVVDGFPLLAQPEVAQIILRALVFLQEERKITLYAYVLMENHLHLIVEGDSLSQKLRLFKSHIARQSLNLFERKYQHRLLSLLHKAKRHHKPGRYHQFWDEGFHPQQIEHPEMMHQKLNYIHFNPVKRGYVDDPCHWRYSSARDYAGMEGLIPVTLFEL